MSVRPEPTEGGLGIGIAAYLAVIKYYGTVKEAAYRLGEGATPKQPKLDPTLMKREIESGDLRRLNKFGDAACIAAIDEVWNEQYGRLVTPEQHALRLLDQAEQTFRSVVNELRQFVGSK